MVGLSRRAIGAERDAPALEHALKALGLAASAVFLYLLLAHVALSAVGFRISPVLEAGFVTLVFFAAAPAAALSAGPRAALRAPARLILLACSGFLPLLFLSSAAFSALRGDAFSYFDYADDAIAWAETFAVQAMKALPIVVIAPLVFTASLAWFERRDDG
ncbi:MAG: hypothetical protein AAFW46_14835 [Pseudomonadota bacterium]